MILAFVMAALTFTNVIQEWQVIVLAALLGVVNAFDAPARQAFVSASEIVTREDLPNAIAMNSMMFNSARVIGPAVAVLRWWQSARPGVSRSMASHFWQSW